MRSGLRERETDGPAGEEKSEGKAGPGEKSNGPAVERFWAAGKKRKRDGVGPAGLKWLRGKRNVLHFFRRNKHIKFKFEFKNSNSN